MFLWQVEKGPLQIEPGIQPIYKNLYIEKKN